MKREICVGDSVILTAVPDWLIGDLPKHEQLEILACIGKEFVVQEIDSHGYYWVGFGATADIEEYSQFSGHSFCVPVECIELSSKFRLPRVT